ncbi:unnamed protein product [Rotaria sp. Silwood2]|nr:unnamed protein product [Rotaria sp. Silwood2]CAF3099912.1 unnamed protein product [Rotaria sp. Silwood2]CAF4465446.1 unnamed protein product [Rotaria sp. Silwood2]CAF4541003.1 unnamed protein product [Rotaria sp. Silwood2]
MEFKNPSFVPSIDLAAASLRQIPFLEKFKKHSLYSSDFRQINHSLFRKMVGHYILFLQLGKRKHLIVPTFDIDLIWHTHLRSPTHYRFTTTALCGYVLLNHDDSIDEKTLAGAFSDTTHLWNSTYNSTYSQSSTNKRTQPSTTVDNILAFALPIGFASSTWSPLRGVIGGSGDGGGCGGGG